jgi:hypothetical protein
MRMHIREVPFSTCECTLHGHERALRHTFLLIWQELDVKGQWSGICLLSEVFALRHDSNDSALASTLGPKVESSQALAVVMICERSGEFQIEPQTQF